MLATGTTDLETNGGTLDVDRLATYIALRGADEDVRDRWMLIIVDACKSAAFVSSLGAALLSKQTPLQYLLLATSERASMSQFSRFRQALELALESFRSVEQVTLCRLVREIKRLLDTAGMVVEQQVDHAVLHNAWAVPAGMLTPADRAPQVEDVMKSLSPVEQHVLRDAASGGLSTTWSYCGRLRELEKVATWLEGDEDLMLVTGAPGSGKSAFLGNLLLRSNKSVWDVMKPVLKEGTREELAPTVEPFAAALRLTGLTLADALSRLAERLQFPLPADLSETADQIDWLVERLSAADGVRTVLVDSLDEAVEPAPIAQALLCRLAATRQVRFVVGTRWSTDSKLDMPDSGVRDLVHALHQPGLRTSIMTLERDGDALLAYVTARMRTLRDNQPDSFWSDLDEELIDVCVRVADRSTDFLFAKLALVEIAALPGLIEPPRVDQLIAGNHASLFSQAVDRLSQERPSFSGLLRALAFRRGRGLPVEQGLWATAASSFTPDSDPPTSQDTRDLVRRAGAYLVMDHEADTTVYRLAHESYEELLRRQVHP